jgi:NAD(P)-dependent dehydrogenase (short-subunit alcohol dehydrogenase family)
MMPFGPFDLSGKVALVTGGNSGIGLGFAEGIAQAGGAVEIWGRNPEKNERAVAALARHGGAVRSRLVDVGCEAEVVAGIADAIAHFGRLDTVFANAGIGGESPFTDFPTETFRKVINVNLEGVFWTLREASRHMVERAKAGDPGGSLVAVSSLATHNGARGNQAYAASKGAILAMVKGCAAEFAAQGIRVNAILPGWILTDMTRQVEHEPFFVERIIPRVPTRRWGKPEDFSGIAVYLASDASAYHTGDMIYIDGGWALS